MTDNSTLRKTLKKRLELELGLPLNPVLKKQIDKEFNDSLILVDFFPVLEISTLKIGGKKLSVDDYLFDESEGVIYLNEIHSGLLYLEYFYGLQKSEYEPLLDLMVEYELDTSLTKDASSISEKNVSVSYDTSMGKGARIQAMIEDLRNKYACVVEMI